MAPSEKQKETKFHREMFIFGLFSIRTENQFFLRKFPVLNVNFLHEGITEKTRDLALILLYRVEKY